MSAHVLLNLLWGKAIKCKAFRAFYRIFKFNKFNNTGA